MKNIIRMITALFRGYKKIICIFPKDSHSPRVLSWTVTGQSWSSIERESRKEAYYCCTEDDDFPITVYTPAGVVKITKEGYDKWLKSHHKEVIDP